MNVSPWERQPGEDIVWFARFERYRLMGRKRSIEQVYAEEGPTAKRGKAKRPNPRWYAVAGEWSWKERAGAWDVSVANEEAAKQAEQRRQLARAVFAKLTKRIDELDTARITWRTYADAMAIIFDELRTEYDQRPVHKFDVTLTYDDILDRVARARGVDRETLRHQMDETLAEFGIEAP